MNLKLGSSSTHTTTFREILQPELAIWDEEFLVFPYFPVHAYSPPEAHELVAGIRLSQSPESGQPKSGRE
jgi:hypothetical protein